jgi:hypothetical protein
MQAMSNRFTKNVTIAEAKPDIATSILAYLRQHPQAADTLRGIVSWWLPQQHRDGACQHVEQALAALVVEGKLCSTELPNGEVLYALSRPTKSPPPN